MGNLTDDQIGFAVESTFGTPVTVSRFLAMLDGTEQSWDNRSVQGQGMLTGSRSPRADRFVPVTYGQGQLTLKAELVSKGFGLLWQLACGVNASTNVSGSTYQQVAHAGITGAVLPSATIQVATARNDGTIDPVTYAGCSATEWELDVPESDLATLEVKFDALTKTRGTALASASYASAPSLFHTDPASPASASAGFGTGALTVPTSTALATASVGSTLIRSWNLAVDNGLDTGRWYQGGRSQPTAGVVTATLKATVEYNDRTLVDAAEAGTPLCFLGDLRTAEALSSGTATFQAALPRCYITDGWMPAPARGETVTTDIECEVKLDGTNRLFYLVARTADNAL